MNLRELERAVALEGHQATAERVADCLTEGHIQPSDLSIKDLAETLVPDGREWVRSLDPQRTEGSYLEAGAGDGVDVTAFSFITSNIIFNKVREQYMSESFIMSRMVDTVKTRLDGEEVPDPGTINTNVTEVKAGMPYHRTGLETDGDITIPKGEKHGLIVPVTRELIFFDRSHEILKRAAAVGEVLGREKEDRILNMVLGLTNSYKVGGTAYDTYQTATPWINKKTSNELVDWTDVDAALLLFSNMTHPITGWPIEIGDANIFVMPAYAMSARRLVTATTTTRSDGSNDISIAGNPISGLSTNSSARAQSLLVASGVAAGTAAKYWWIGNFRKAFAWYEHWPIQVSRAGRTSSASFEADIVMQFKASSRGAAATLEPRQVVWNTG